MNNRRKLVIALGAGALAAPFGAFAQQQGKVWRVGFLGTRRPVFLDTDAYGAFPRGMRELGYVEGKNLAIEWRFADGHDDRLHSLAAELVRLNVDVILAAGTPAARAAQRETSKIPIVIAAVGDPVGTGLVASLSRPGGNITGVSNLAVDLSNKSLEFLIALVPKLSRIAVLLNPTDLIDPIVLRQIQSAAGSIGVRVLPFEAATVSQINAAFAAIAQEHIQALVVAPDPFFISQARPIAELAAKGRLPAIYTFREHVSAGGLMSYGSNNTDNFQRAAFYADKILKGAKPGDLPVEQPTKFELVLNLKTAKAMGIKFPNSILVRADKGVE